MPQRDVTIETADGPMGASLHTPDVGNGPWPAVIMYPDAGGVRPVMRDMGQRLADYGYVVVVPDPFHRSGPFEPFDMQTVFSDEAERKRLFALIGSATKDGSARDTAAILDFLDTLPEVTPGAKIGTTGYCTGGGLALNAAGRFGERVGAAASFHGGRLATDAPDSPHLLAPSITAKVYVGAARDDGSFDAAQAEVLTAAFDAARVDYELVWYDALHGWCMEDFPVYDARADEQHWEAMTRLFGETLDPVDPSIETETFDLDGDGKVSLAEEARARMGLLDARLEEAAEHGGITGKIAGAVHKLTDKLDND
ncbi:MAG: dienelactone hydrolase family protein [Ilumatobacteraceae bacterium]